MPINPIDARIVQTLGFSFRSMTVHEISQSTGISWITVRAHITKLISKGIITEKKTNGGRYVYRLSSKMY